MPSFQARNTGAGLALVRKREAVDERRMLQQELQIEGDAGVPGRLDGQRERLDTGGRKGAQSSGLRLRNGRAGGLARRADFVLRLRGLRVMPKGLAKFGPRRTSPKPL